MYSMVDDVECSMMFFGRLYICSVSDDRRRALFYHLDCSTMALTIYIYVYTQPGPGDPSVATQRLFPLIYCTYRWHVMRLRRGDELPDSALEFRLRAGSGHGPRLHGCVLYMEMDMPVLGFLGWVLLGKVGGGVGGDVGRTVLVVVG